MIHISRFNSVLLFFVTRFINYHFFEYVFEYNIYVLVKIYRRDYIW